MQTFTFKSRFPKVVSKSAHALENAQFQKKSPLPVGGARDKLAPRTAKPTRTVDSDTTPRQTKKTKKQDPNYRNHIHNDIEKQKI